MALTDGGRCERKICAMVSTIVRITVLGGGAVVLEMGFVIIFLLYLIKLYTF